MAKQVTKKNAAAKRPAKSAVKKPSASAQPAAKKSAIKAATKKVASKKPVATKTVAAKKKASASTSKMPAAKTSSTKNANSSVTNVAKMTKKAADKSGAKTIKATASSKAAPEKSDMSEKKSVAAKSPARKSASRGRPKKIVLPAGYSPQEDEDFMSDLQREYFRQKLVNWKEEIIRQTRETLEELTQDSLQHADIADRATSETDRALELRARDRQRKLVNKINAALSRMDDGSYGYCDETGEPIGLKRLVARPIATLSLEAQERHERRERVYRED